MDIFGGFGPLHFFGLASLGGLGLIAWAMLERGRSDLLAAARPARSSELTDGELVALEGTATGHEALTAPVSGRPCVYYHHNVWRLESETRRRRTSSGTYETYQTTTWVPARSIDSGGFYVRDEAGLTFVLPSGARLELSRPVAKRAPALGAVGDERIEETYIEQGEALCVIGRSHPVLALTGGVHLERVHLPPDQLRRLTSEESGLPCFFDDGGPFWIADRPLDRLKRDLASSASTLLWSGAAIAALGVLGVAAAALGYL